MSRFTKTLLTCLILVLGLLMAVRGAEAQPQISSELLLPYFEVETAPSGMTTLFAVGNALDEPVDIVLTLHSNWGIPVDRASLTLAPHQVRSFNLRDWLTGSAPGRKLDGKQVAHLKAALSGQRSPQDSLFYSTAIRTGLAVGYVRVKTQKTQPVALWGDYFVVEPAEKSTQGEALVAIGQGASCPGLCARHVLRYLLSGAFNAGTEVIVWTEKAGAPSRQPSADPVRLTADSDLYTEAGVLFDGFQVRTLPVQVITLGQLAIKQPFGWLDLRTEMDSFVAVRYRLQNQGSALLRSWCLPVDTSSEGPGIAITKLTNGQDANVPPGPSIPVGSPVLWEYVVRNTGDVALSGIEVKDDQGVAVSCPRTSLSKGESMTCTGHGTAIACQYSNLGTVTGRTHDGALVSGEDPSHYFGEAAASIDLEKLTNGEDADTAPGPQIAAGAPVTWTYVVRNTGEVALTGVRVDDDREGAVSCPKSSLRPGEAMTCTLHGTAVSGQYSNLGTASGETSCGKTVRDEDASHYVSPSQTDEPAAIDIEKHTNGQDADTATGPEIQVGQPVLWEYIVTNTGKTALTGIQVTDDRGVVVSCPRTSLGIGESMTCTGHGTAVAGQYANLGTVTGRDAAGKTVTDSDPSHYFGVLPPPDLGDQGCSPGYWKNHEGSWPPAGYSTGQTVQSAFGEASRYPAFGSAALIGSLSFQGGPGVEGGVGNLLRAATASLLNSAHPGVDFPRTPAQVIGDVNDALASGSRDQMLGLAASLDADNNLSCPLD
jgi:hypothetical protein